ncbi:MAG: hypothetical protein WCI18_07460 [Pseudomonadota bacterium]
MAREHLEEARRCQTKKAWESFFKDFGSELTSLNPGEIVKLITYLKQDKDSKYFGEGVFSALIAVCRAQKCFEQGLDLYKFVEEQCYPLVSLETAHLLLENSKPKDARYLALKALRRKTIPIIVEVKLRLLICNSFAEEGLHHFAAKHFVALEHLAEHQDIPLAERADIQVSIARLHFFSGHLPRAARHYQLATKFALEEGNEELAARSLFNTAAALHNSGHESYEKSYAFARECRALSQKNGYAFILAHVESFFGLDAHIIGHFTKAHQHFESALGYLTESDLSYSRVHFLSLLTILCFEEANFSKGLELAQRTLELSENDHSNRYKSRYRNIEAHYLWETGKYSESYSVLQEAVKQIKSNGIVSNEDYNTWNQFIKFSALLGAKSDPGEPTISHHIRHTSYHISENQIALARILFNKRDYSSALNIYERVFETALERNNLNHQMYCLMGIFACKNAQKASPCALETLLSRFEACHSLMGKSVHTGYLYILGASLEMKRNKPKFAENQLRKALQSNALPSHYRFIVETWLKCLRGRRVDFPNLEIYDIFENSTKFFFPIILSWNSDKSTLTSSLGSTIDFKDFPILKDILICLIDANESGLSAAELFTKAWNESLKTQGWRQKLNNALSRLRWQCRGLPFPLFKKITNGWAISDAFLLEAEKKNNDLMRRKNQILLYSSNKPASAAEMSEKLQIPLASVKRMISNLSQSGKLSSTTNGRNVVYSSSVTNLGNPIHPETSQS